LRKRKSATSAIISRKNAPKINSNILYFNYSFRVLVITNEEIATGRLLGGQRADTEGAIKKLFISADHFRLWNFRACEVSEISREG
jgi:hypothetical protein